MNKIRTAVIGAGFMGKVHAEGIRRLANVEIAAVAGVSSAEAQTFGEAVCVDCRTADYREILADPSIQAVHVCTPNVLHYPISKAALEGGKAVLCEKPLTMTAAEARELVDLAARTGLPNCVNHNLRYYPVLQHLRRIIEKGELGEIVIVQGTYSQDWLLYDTDYNWRVEAKHGGKLRCMGDVGSHWMDMIQHLTGHKITTLCADLHTFLKSRKKPKAAVEAFANKLMTAADYDEIPIDTDDYGAVMLHMSNGARGAFTVSQMSAGCKNRFQIELFGTKGGAIWNQERPDELWLGERDTPNRLILKDPSLLEAKARSFADLPGGHSEGYDDTHKQVYRRFYARVADKNAPVDYPTFEDGLRGMLLLEKVIESVEKRGWVDTGLAGQASA
jgi:predicted dehydrogenase